MWIPKGAALIRAKYLFEVQCLLEEIWYLVLFCQSFQVSVAWLIISNHRNRYLFTEVFFTFWFLSSHVKIGTKTHQLQCQKSIPKFYQTLLLQKCALLCTSKMLYNEVFFIFAGLLCANVKSKNSWAQLALLL